MNRTVLKRFFWILLAAPYFKPAVLGVLEGTGWLETIFDIWRMGAAVVIGGSYLYEMIRERRRPSGVLMWCWLPTVQLMLMVASMTVS
jgi:hypothetical protein